jgi:hypothetical protein
MVSHKEVKEGSRTPMGPSPGVPFQKTSNVRMEKWKRKERQAPVAEKIAP